MLRFCRNIAGTIRSSVKHTPTSPEQSRKMSTEFETNSKWKATCVDLSKVSTALSKRKAA